MEKKSLSQNQNQVNEWLDVYASNMSNSGDVPAAGPTPTPTPEPEKTKPKKEQKECITGKITDLNKKHKEVKDWFAKEKWTTKWGLHLASFVGDIKMIEKLIKEGADPNGKMTVWFDSEPLGWAASGGVLDGVKLLIRLGADPLRPRNKAGESPLSDAERENHRNIIDFLRAYEKEFRGPYKTFKESKELMNLVDTFQPENNLSKYKDFLKWYDKEFTNKWPLQRASYIGDLDQIQKLIKEGSDPNEKMTDWYDSEPLGWAASSGNLEAVKLLIRLGADPERPANTAGNTPLRDAEREKHRDVIDFLKKYRQLSGRE